MAKHQSFLHCLNDLVCKNGTKSMLHYLTTDIGSMISYTRLRPSTALNMGIAGGLAWHLTYNRMFIGMPDITGPAGLDVTEES